MYLSCEDKKEEDTTPPTVSISSPVSGQTVNEIITITITTQDNEGISKVEFFIDDSLVLIDTESPYEYQWNTTQYEDDSEHIIKVISYDNSDNSTESQPIMLIVDNSTSRPNPSVLYPIIYDNGFQISWSQNTDDDFQSYKLYESLFEDITNQTLIYETDDRTDTTYFKTIQNVRYYQITNEDVWGLQSISNIEVGDYYVELWGEYYSVLNTTNLGSFNNQLTGFIPPEIGNLTNLTFLELSNNQLTGEIPPEIWNLTNLTFLGSSNNQLTGEIPPEIGNLTNLIGLGLYNNQLTGEIPSEIGDLTNLTHLNLGSNQLTGSIPSEIGNLTNLTYLRLSWNQLTGEIPPEIWNLTNLVELNLYNNQLTGIIPDEICNLYIPFLSSNQFCPPYPYCLEYYYHLWYQDTTDCN